MKKKIFVLVIAALFVACSTFIPEEQQVEWKNKFEGKVYILQKDVAPTKETFLESDIEKGDVKSLKKGDEVFLHLVFYNATGFDTGSYIKVLVYKNEGSDPLLKQKRYFLFYVFAEDYLNEEGEIVYTEDVFAEELKKWVKPKKK